MSAGIEISKTLVFVNSASSILRSLLSFSVLIWVQSYLVSNVPEAEYKVLALVYPLLLFVPLLSMVVTGGVGRFVTEAYAKGDSRRVTQITSTMFPLAFLIGIAIFVVGGFLTWNIEAVLNLNPAYTLDAKIMFSILVFTAGVRVMVMPFMLGIQVKQKFLFSNVLGLCLEVLRIAILFSLLFGVSTRVLWFVIAALPVTVIDIAVSFVYSKRLVPELRFRQKEIRRELLRPIVHFGGWTFVGRASAVAREMCGPMILTHFTGLSSDLQVQCYRLGSYVETRFFPTVLGPLLTMQPALTAMFATGQEDRLRRTYFRMSRYILWAFLFFGGPAMVFHQELWTVWLGEVHAKRTAAGALVLVLLFAKSFFVFQQPILAQISLAKGRANGISIRVLIIELSTVALAYYLVRYRDMGAVGIAAATLGASAIGAPLLNWTFALSLLDAKFSWFVRETLKPGLMPFVGAMPVWLLIHFYARPTNWWELALAGGAGCAVYAFIAWRFCLPPNEREQLGTLLGKIRKKLGR